MSVLATTPQTQSLRLERWLNVTVIAVLLWLEISVPMFVQALHHAENLAITTDDAMRIVQIRDLLGGQSWFDLTQWRMNTPIGVPMHWSRVVDIPIALLILLFRLFLDPKTAETVAICLWPLLLLLPAWIAVGRLATRLAGRECGIMAVLLAAACIPVISYFRPGEIDHHNAQIVLTLWSVVFLAELDTNPRAPAGAAIMSALSLAIGLETLPYVLAGALTMAVLWLIEGDAVARQVRRFGLVFAWASLFLVLTVVARREAFNAACDTFSGFYAIAAVAGGLGLWMLTTIPFMDETAAWRLIGLIALALILAGLTFGLAPQCLHGPYGGMDARLWPIFLNDIGEAQSPFAGMANEPGSFLGGYGYAAFAAIGSIAAIFLVEDENRWAALVVAVFTLVALAVFSWQLRGLPFAILLGLPGLGATIRRLIVAHVPRGAALIGVSTLSLLLLNNYAFGFVGARLLDNAAYSAWHSKAMQQTWDCFLPPATAQLAKLPPGRVLAFEDQGPAILAYTRDSVVAGPYHRNAGGLIDTYDFFTQPPDAGVRTLKARNIDYVMTCNRGGNRAFYLNKGGHNGLLARLERGEPPAWLEPIPPVDKKNASRIFRVLPDQLPH